jgi:hypothetical protein
VPSNSHHSSVFFIRRTAVVGCVPVSVFWPKSTSWKGGAQIAPVAALPSAARGSADAFAAGKRRLQSGRGREGRLIDAGVAPGPASARAIVALLLLCAAALGRIHDRLSRLHRERPPSRPRPRP